MSSWILYSSLFLLSLISWLIIINPFSKRKFLRLLLPCYLVVLGLAYQLWGEGTAWHAFQTKQIKDKQAQEFLATVKNPEELISRLKNRLKSAPSSAKGWFLLGRLYMNQSQWNNAVKAMNQAMLLKPNDTEITINYIECLLQQNEQRFNQKIRNLLAELISHVPNQPDALALLAVDAYQEKNFRLAEQYWTKLLTLVPEQSKEAVALRKAIANAKVKQQQSKGTNNF